MSSMAGDAQTVRVLFVCTGNICRSPTAEGVFRAMVAACGLAGRIEIESAGTGDWHVGEPPDERACRAAALRGIDLTAQRARQVTERDFDRFDLIIALDCSHQRALRAMAPAGAADRIRLLMDFAPQAGVSDVPDPYYGALGGFDRVLDLIEAGADGLLRTIREEYLRSA
jgi:protein-tyrosine phosphatase